MKLKTQLGLLSMIVGGILLGVSFVSAQAPADKKLPTKIAASDSRPSLVPGKEAAAAIVYGKDGKIQLVAPDGKPVEQCQLCSPELEAKFGKNCLKAGDHAKELAALTPKLCRGAGSPQTSLKGLSSISAVRHSGSECYTWYICNGGTCDVYQYCW